MSGPGARRTDPGARPPALATERFEEALLLFARHPEAGKAKTRLIPLLGAEGAARLHERLAIRAAGEGSALERPELRRAIFVEPPERCAETARRLAPSFEAVSQTAGALGARLAAGFAWAFERGAERAIAIGADCPDLDREILEAAFASLALHDAVLGPAHDGGYYLIGLTGRGALPLAAVFDGIPWSTERVLGMTLERLRDHRCATRLLPLLRDLDTPEDYRELLPRWRDLLLPA